MTTLNVIEGDSGSTTDELICMTVNTSGLDISDIEIMILPSSTAKGRLLPYPMYAVFNDLFTNHTICYICMGSLNRIEICAQQHVLSLPHHFAENSDLRLSRLSVYEVDDDSSGASPNNNMAYLRPYNYLEFCFNVTIIGDSAVEDNFEYAEIQVAVRNVTNKHVTIIIQDDDGELHANGTITFLS